MRCMCRRSPAWEAQGTGGGGHGGRDEAVHLRHGWADGSQLRRRYPVQGRVVQHRDRVGVVLRVTGADAAFSSPVCGREGTGLATLCGWRHPAVEMPSRAVLFSALWPRVKQVTSPCCDRVCAQRGLAYHAYDAGHEHFGEAKSAWCCRGFWGRARPRCRPCRTSTFYDLAEEMAAGDGARGRCVVVCRPKANSGFVFLMFRVRYANPRDRHLSGGGGTLELCARCPPSSVFSLLL